MLWPGFCSEDFTRTISLSPHFLIRCELLSFPLHIGEHGGSENLEDLPHATRLGHGRMGILMGRSGSRISAVNLEGLAGYTATLLLLIIIITLIYCTLAVAV